MKRLFPILLTIASLARADEARWEFKKGLVWTWEAETVLEWSCARASREADERMGHLKSRQVEKVTIRMEVLSVDAEGRATIRGTFPRVHVDHVGLGGKEEWDSAESKETELLGFKRYETLFTTTFTAVVEPDGTIVEAKNALTPKPAPTPNTAKEHKEIFAQAFHHPTSPRAWLDLIFVPCAATPKGRTRTMRFIEDEEVEINFARIDRKDGRSCSKLELESQDRAVAADPKEMFAHEHSDPNALAWAAVRRTRKKAEVWFAREDRCLARIEATADTSVGYDSKAIKARMDWTIELKSVERPK